MTEKTLDQANAEQALANAEMAPTNRTFVEAQAIRQLVDADAFTSESIVTAVTSCDLRHLEAK